MIKVFPKIRGVDCLTLCVLRQNRLNAAGFQQVADNAVAVVVQRGIFQLCVIDLIPSLQGRLKFCG
ncbi:hypothetical protein Y887_17410 [Xanthomonas pisi DSM 18956]|nr:hypothetical protein Y887_17410 [Xanthomonas pisi DSM 18956]